MAEKGSYVEQPSHRHQAQRPGVLTLGCDPLPASLPVLVCLTLGSRNLFLELGVPLSSLARGLSLFQEQNKRMLYRLADDCKAWPLPLFFRKMALCQCLMSRAAPLSHSRE